MEVRVQGLTEEHKRLATPQINFCGLSSQNRGWLQTGVNGVCVQAPRPAFTRLSGAIDCPANSRQAISAAHILLALISPPANQRAQLTR